MGCNTSVPISQNLTDELIESDRLNYYIDMNYTNNCNNCNNCNNTSIIDISNANLDNDIMI